MQKGFSLLQALLLAVVLGIIGFTGWYVYDSQQKTNQNLSGADAQGTKSSFSVPSDWQKIINKNYTFYMPKSYSAQPVPVEYAIEDETVASTDTMQIVQDKSPELGLFNVEYSPTFTEPLVKGTAEEIAKKSHETNRTDTNPIYKVEVGQIYKLTTKNGQLFCFKTHKGFATDYNIPSNGSGMLFGNAQYIRACFGQTKNGNVVRFLISDDDKTMENVLKSIELS